MKRLKNADAALTPNAVSKMRVAGKAMIGKKYHLEFGWGDDKIYYSELIWKIYKRGAGSKSDGCSISRISISRIRK